MIAKPTPHTQLTNTDPLWRAFYAIHNYYNAQAPMPADIRAQATITTIQCMIGLLDRIDLAQFTTYEKAGLSAAKLYWLENATDLAPVLAGVSNTVENRITYRDPPADNRMYCVTQILAIDNDHFDAFPEFLENIRIAGLSNADILTTVHKHFNFVPELKNITA